MGEGATRTILNRMAPLGYPTSPYATTLRENMTRAERTMWFAVRDRRLESYKFRRQASIEGFVVDFRCLEVRLVVELDGGQHTPEVDANRTARIEAAGFRIVRFWNYDVLQNLEGVLTVLLGHLRRDPSPNPLPEGEGF